MDTNFSYGETLLHVSDLSVAYGDKVIIKDINFSERDVLREGKVQGQIVAFVGRSGRGKSTLFRAITGLIHPKTGKILIPDTNQESQGERIPAKIVSEGDVGFVNQKYTLFRHKTIYQALLYALRKSEIGKQEKHDKIMDALNTWGLEKFKDQYPNELSGGQRQRTAIIEQIFSSGYFLVMDEPFSGLDVGNIISVKEAFNIINVKHEFNTIIFSTHDINLAVELADSIYVIGYDKLEDGTMSHYGTIVRNFNLKELGLAWQEFGKGHLDLVNEVKKVMLAC
jgi:ABC-type nitrate/sulfonate/bicarbonate transport system ATPase subunit